VGKWRINAAKMARSAQSRRGFGLVLRSTATSLAQDEQLDVLGRRGAAEQRQPAQEPVEDQVEQA
jgi:hypothetical protein